MCCFSFSSSLPCFSNGLQKCFIQCSVIRYPDSVWPASAVLIWHVISFHTMRINDYTIMINLSNMWNLVLQSLKTYISTTTTPMTTKHGRVATYHDGLQLIKSHDPLITWSCRITWQTKIIISPLTKCLCPPNSAGW